MSLQQYLREHYSAATARAYEREIEIYLVNYADAENVGYSEVMDYIGRLRQRYSNPQRLTEYWPLLRYIMIFYVRLNPQNQQ